MIDVFRQRSLQLLFGSFYNPNFFIAQQKAVKKFPILKQKYSFLKRLQCFRNGFTSDKLIWYDFKKYDKSLYVSDLIHYRDLEQIDWKYYYIAHNKLVFERYFSHFCNVVPTIGYIDRGRYFNISCNEDIFDFSSLKQAILNGNVFYFKPYDGGSGRGIGKVAFDGTYILWNDLPYDLLSFDLLLGSLSGYLVQHQFVQKGFSHDVNPDSLNTLRVVTMQDVNTREPFVAYALHRIGRKGSYVDNIAKKNLICPIDVRTGVIKYAVIYPLDGVLRKVQEHPDTHLQIGNHKIPNWGDVESLVLKLSKQIPFMPLCGWDIILSGDNIYVQELNYNPDIYLGQVDAPLLMDNRVKEFVDYYTHKKRK